MKIEIMGSVNQTANEWGHPPRFVIGEGLSKRTILKPEDYDPNDRKPRRVGEYGGSGDGMWWLFRGKVLRVTELRDESELEVILRVKHLVLREEKRLGRIEREVEAFENLEALPTARRERIPDSVKLFVWQRDKGRCVKCGGQERLEFDHVIPVADGGSNTERNIQLLCENCNREKGKSVR